jgi:hypothetical protein
VYKETWKGLSNIFYDTRTLKQRVMLEKLEEILRNEHARSSASGVLSANSHKSLKYGVGFS